MKKMGLMLLVDVCMILIMVFQSETSIQVTQNQKQIFETWLEQNTHEVAAKDMIEEQKKVALTFDDGPNQTYTPILLDGLKERGVEATFFLIGKSAQKYPELVKREVEEGHVIGNHTYSHIELTSSNVDKFRKELIKTNQLLKQQTGQEISFVRPPFGVWKKSFEQELNMIPVMWTVDPHDWNTYNTQKVVQRVVTVCQENDIILLHDCYETSVEAALEIVDALQEEGFTFVTVDEILFD